MNAHRQASGKRPLRKVSAAGLSGAVTTVVLWLVELSGVEVPAVVAAAVTTIVAASMGYYVPSAPYETHYVVHRTV